MYRLYRTLGRAIWPTRMTYDLLIAKQNKILHCYIVVPRMSCQTDRFAHSEPRVKIFRVSINKTIACLFCFTCNKTISRIQRTQYINGSNSETSINPMILSFTFYRLDHGFQSTEIEMSWNVYVFGPKKKSTKEVALYRFHSIFEKAKLPDRPVRNSKKKYVFLQFLMRL